MTMISELPTAKLRARARQLAKLNGHRGDVSLDEAFNWGNTVEDVDFWVACDLQYWEEAKAMVPELFE